MARNIKRALGVCATTVGVFVLAVNASAQCTFVPGPDVIVGDLTGPANYGVSAGMDALSLGTTSCNIGVVELNWFSSTNQHPVIGGNLYRYKVIGGAGHFDQVGQSWLKHAFTALQGNVCCNNCTPSSTGGTHLGVGCSDPYTASRNGSQSGLGPKWSVNARSGVYAYPVPHPSGGNAGRIEVDVAELEATGAGTRYFGDSMYINNDDAVAGNGNNNASYREVTTSVVAPGSYNFAFSGSTVRQQAGINGWKLADPLVTLQNLTVPAENGFLIFGFRTTSLGGGQFHYQYALYNMNSDTAIGSFSVPIPLGVSVTNISFHDVAYRYGDGTGGVNYDGTDWPGVVSGGNLVWATTPFATNNNANAIRWGTLYSFGFDANAAPATGNLTFGTYKVVGTFTTTGDVPGSAAPGTPFCYGDGSGTFCPCTNLGSPGNGCANSANSAGAVVASSGTTSPDTVVMSASGEPPTANSILLQGDTNAAPGLIFGDGIRCANGNLKRLYVHAASGGSVSAPIGGDPSITTQSATLGDTITPGSTRYYQFYYRDPDPTFCSIGSGGNTWNATNGQIVTW